MSKLPGPRIPAIAQTLWYFSRPEPFFFGCHRKYGDLFEVETVVFGREVCIVRPELIKQIFTGDSNDLRAGDANEALGPLVGSKSVLLLDGDEHLRQRRLLMPPFHGERMSEYASTVRAITTRAMSRWKKGVPFTIHRETQAITLEVILLTIFGADAEDALADDLREKLTVLVEMLASPISMLGTIPALRVNAMGLSPWARFQAAIASVNALIYKQIAKRRAEHAKGDTPRTDILSLLILAKDENGDGMTDEELRDELITLLVAGHETTATELAWCFDFILRDTRVLRALRDEAANAPAGEKTPLPYLEATIREVLRLRPVIPSVGRRVMKDMTLGGFDIPKGVMLVPAVCLTHRLPDIYKDPNAFKPERFLDVKPDPYAWIPFGGGVRRCIGMAFAMLEMKVVLSTILTRARLRATRSDRSEVGLRGFTHAPKGGVEVILEGMLDDSPEKNATIRVHSATEAQARVN